MIWALVVVGVIVVLAVAVGAVNRVSADLAQTVTPALLEIDDAVEAVAESIPFEVSSVLSHDDVDRIIRWVLDWFDEIGLASEFGEELGGEWVEADRLVVDEIAATNYAVARAIDTRSKFDPVHVTVVVDEFLRWLREIGAVGDEVW